MPPGDGPPMAAVNTCGAFREWRALIYLEFVRAARNRPPAAVRRVRSIIHAIIHALSSMLLDLADGDGRTSLMLAAQQGHADVVYGKAIGPWEHRVNFFVLDDGITSPKQVPGLTDPRLLRVEKVVSLVWLVRQVWLVLLVWLVWLV